MNNQIVPTQPRRLPDTQELWDLIDRAVIDQNVNRNAFTAYTITKLLRTNYPDLEIEHPDVQARVHFLMDSVTDYEMVWQDWNGIQARTYQPVLQLPQQIPTQQQQPAPQPPAALPPGKFTRIPWDDDTQA